MEKEQITARIDDARLIDHIESVRIDINRSKTLTAQEKEELRWKANMKLGKIYERIEDEEDQEFLAEMAGRLRVKPR